MRSTWTDSRLDELNGNVVALNHRVGHLDQRVDELGRSVEKGFARVDGELRDLRAEFGALNRTLIQVGGGVVGTLLVGFLGLIATRI